MQTLRTAKERILSEHWATTVILSISFLIPVAVAYAGSFRPYDALPDQDLLWLSEALRLFRNAPPDYIDHPGSYWSLSYLAKLKILSFRGIVEFITTRPGEAISPVDAALVIKLSRIEQGIICGFCTIGLWPIWKALGTPTWLGLCNTVCFSLSPGMMWESIRIRNESTSLFFFILFLNLVIASSASTRLPDWRSWLKAVLAVSALIFAIYCKLQILILMFFLLPILLILICPRISINELHISRLRRPIDKKLVYPIFMIAIIILSWISITSNWSYAPDPPFHHRHTFLNITFWIYINSLIVLIVNQSFFSGSIYYLIRSSWTVVFIEFFFGRVLFHAKWTAQVFLTPASIISFGNSSKGSLLNNFEQILASLNALPTAFSIMLYGVMAAIIAIIYTRRDQKRWFCLSAAAVMAVPGIWLATASRLKLHYGIYLMPIILIFLSVALISSKTLSKKGVRDAKIFSALVKILQVSAISLLIGFWSGSMKSVLEIPQYISYSKTDRQICFSQHMDSLMSLTSAGKCPNFERERIE